MDDRTRAAIALWTTAQPAVMAFVHSVVRDRSLREDLLQAIAVRVIESFDRFDRSRAFVPWAIGIARHAIVDERRRSQRSIRLDDAALDAVAQAFERVAERESQLSEHLGNCLEQLDERAREICTLRYRQGMTPAAIAVAMSIQPNTVSKALQRLREQLRRCIEERSVREGLT